MTQPEYEAKKRECWEEFLQKHEISGADGVTADAFIMAFDCAFAIGKQEKDAEETPISERLYEEEKSQLEGLYYYLKRKADEQENDYVSVAILFEAMERLENMFGIDLLTNGHGKPAPKDADTVIQGWVFVDETTFDRHLCIRKVTQGDYEAVWDSGHPEFCLGEELFPDMVPNKLPEPVEIIIKRKKNG